MKTGDKVRMTQLGIDMALDGRKHRRTGTVMGRSFCGKYLRIRRDGEKVNSKWAHVFWERAEDETK